MLVAPVAERSARVLVADDDASILNLIEVNLSLEGFEVLTAERGEEALEKARQGRVDLIVLDVMMPGMDGWDVCERLKEDRETAEIPIVILSARNLERERRRAAALGVEAYVTKPFDPDDLLRLARSLTGAGS